jgi:hypothetical protein
MRDDLTALGSRFSRKLRVVTIYIAEAHAQEEWPIGDEHKPQVCALAQPRTLHERREAACLFVRELSWPFEVYVDGMCDSFEHAFAAWPVRFFVVGADGRTIVHIAEPKAGEYTYDVDDLAAAIEAHLGATGQ